MKSSASFKEIIDFQTNICKKHKDVVDVFRFNKLELSSALRRGSNGTVVLLDSIEVDPNANTSGKVIHRNKGAFTVLGKKDTSTSDITNYDAQNDVLDHCQTIAFEIAARYKYESNIFNEANKWLYNNIDINSFSYFKVGPIFADNLYGYRCEFTIKSIENFIVDPGMWEDLEKKLRVE